MDEDDVEKIQELPRRQETHTVSTPTEQSGYKNYS